MTKPNARLAGAVALAAALLSSAAHAGVLYDNPPGGFAIGVQLISGHPGGPNGQAADSFVPSNPGAIYDVVTGVQFDTWTDPGEYVTSVDWAILDGSPGLGGKVLESGTAAVTSAFYVTNLYSSDIDINTFSVAPLQVSDNGTYWLELQNAVTNDGGLAYWDQTVGASQNWNNQGRHLLGNTFEILNTDASVPEPASWAMMLIGFGGLGAAMRARRKAVAAAMGFTDPRRRPPAPTARNSPASVRPCSPRPRGAG